MNATPIIPFSGFLGWRFLQKTYDQQIERHANSPRQSREIQYFRENISSVTSAQDLISDRVLLKVALGAFGLQQDLDNRAFVRAILESHLGDPKSLASRISDDRYKDITKAFGFSSAFGPNTAKPSFANTIVEKYTSQSFEIAVGEQFPDMRLALTAKRELFALSTEGVSDNTKWFKLLGRPPLRNFLETALGLPDDFGKIDLDQQLATVKSKSLHYFGVDRFEDFSNGSIMDQAIKRFHLLSQINTNNQMTSNTIALQLLQN